MFVSDNSKRLVVTLDKLQGREYYAVTIHNMMNDLCTSLEAAKTRHYSGLTNGLPVRTARQLHTKFVQAFDQSVDKLRNYTDKDTRNPARCRVCLRTLQTLERSFYKTLLQNWSNLNPAATISVMRTLKALRHCFSMVTLKHHGLNKSINSH